MNRPDTTLFILTSVDGKISTGDTDNLDVDRDYKDISELAEGLQQYYDLEQETDLFSLNTGRVFAKIGVNEKTDEPKRLEVSYVIVDSLPHLTSQGVAYLAKKAKKIILITTNPQHPAFEVRQTSSNIEIILYQDRIDFMDAFSKLASDYHVDNLTIQSGGTLTATLVRERLIDKVLLVVAPVLVGGKDTPTVMDGESLHDAAELSKLKTLELVRAQQLKNSYLLLEYKVKN